MSHDVFEGDRESIQNGATCPQRFFERTLERYNRSGVEGWKPEFPALSNPTC